MTGSTVARINAKSAERIARIHAKSALRVARIHAKNAERIARIAAASGIVGAGFNLAVILRSTV